MDEVELVSHHSIVARSSRRPVPEPARVAGRVHGILDPRAVRSVAAQRPAQERRQRARLVAARRPGGRVAAEAQPLKGRDIPGERQVPQVVTEQA